MNDDELLAELLQRLDSKAPLRRELNLYARAEQPLAFLAPEARQALNNRFGRIASNIPRLAVQSVAERMRVVGFDGVDIWDVWTDQDMEELAQTAIKESLTLGQAFFLVWADEQGKPTISVESAEQCCVLRNASDRTVVSGLKRYRTATETHCYVYLPDEIRHYVANSPSAGAGFTLTEVIPNPLGFVNLIPITNTDRLLDEDGYSEVTDLRCLVDGLNAALAGLAVALEFSARPRRWAVGLELRQVPRLDDDGNPALDEFNEPVMDTVNPVEETARMAVSESPDTVFGQWEGARLDGYRSAVDIWMQQIMACSGLSAHMCGITTSNPASADAIRSAESSLTAKAFAKHRAMGRAFEQLARCVVAIRDGVPVDSVTVRVRWADPSTRSPAAEMDAAVKAWQSGLLSRTATLRRLGFSESEIEDELRLYRRDAEMAADLSLGRYVTRTATHGDGADMAA